METNGVTPEWGCNPFWIDSLLFNQSSVTSVIAALTLELMLTLGVTYKFPKFLSCLAIGMLMKIRFLAGKR